MVKLVNTQDFMKVYPNTKMYGPYKSKQDNRLRVVLVCLTTKKKTTISYPKYLVEIKLNRYLTKKETVHHIDGNPLNNDLSNLTVLPLKKHASLDSKKRIGQELICQWCKTSFFVEGHVLRYRERTGDNANSFCSKSCSGKYGKYVQLTGKRIKKVKIDKAYAQEQYIGNSILEELNIGEILTVKADDNTEA